MRILSFTLNIFVTFSLNVNYKLETIGHTWYSVNECSVNSDVKIIVLFVAIRDKFDGWYEFCVNRCASQSQLLSIA